MNYTVKVTQKTKDLQDLSFRTYDIFDDVGKLVGHAVRRGKDVIFQLIGGPTVKRQASNVERAINNWAADRAKLGEVNSNNKRPSAALRGIAEAEKELSPWNFKKRSEQEIALRKAKGTEKYNQQRLERTKDTRSTFDEIEDRVLEIVGQDAYTSKDPRDVERVENVRLAVKRTLKRSDPNIDREGRALSKLERSVEVRSKGSTGYKDF